MSGTDNPFSVVAQIAVYGIVILAIAGLLYGFPTEWAMGALTKVIVLSVLGAIAAGFGNALVNADGDLW